MESNEEYFVDGVPSAPETSSLEDPVRAIARISHELDNARMFADER